jgi:predicted lipoprotein with Yx(FWY)xxD motif
MLTRSSALVALTAMAVVACGGTGGSATASPTPAATVMTATATVDGASKTILVDSKGMTLYYFTPDKGGKVTCKGACLAAWPALLLPAGTTQPSAGAGVTGTLATVANDEAKGTQVLYNNWPLYYYIKDKKPGDTTGQNVGGKWFVVPPDLASS